MNHLASNNIHDKGNEKEYKMVGLNLYPNYAVVILQLNIYYIYNISCILYILYTLIVYVCYAVAESRNMRDCISNIFEALRKIDVNKLILYEQQEES